MFDKYRERFAKFEEDHESVRKMRIHLEKNGKVYLVGAGCLGAGYLLRRPQVIEIVNEVSPAIAPVIAPVITNNNIVIAALGDPGNVVECVETGVKYASQGQLARTIGESAVNVGHHLHGKIPDLHGLHYQVIGKAGHPLA
jgi:hypothetical protein